MTLLLVSSNTPFTKEDKMAKACVLGYNVTNTKGYNNRTFVKNRVENLKKKTKTIVLGSSRSMKIDAEVLGSKKMHNIGVSSGVLQDVLGLYGVYAFNFSHPKKVCLVIDPWFLLDKKKDERWKKSYKSEAIKMQGLISGKDGVEFDLIDRSEKVNPKDLSEVYSLSDYHLTFEELTALKQEKVIYKEFTAFIKKFETYSNRKLAINEVMELPFLYDSLKSDEAFYINETGERLAEETSEYRSEGFEGLEFYQKLNIVKLNRVIFELSFGIKAINRCDEIITRKEVSKEVTRMVNGTINYKPFYENSTVKAINKRARKRGPTPFMAIANQSLSKQKVFKSTFEKFIQYLLSNEVKITVAMVPFHPIVEKQLKDPKFAFASEVEAYLKDYGIKNNLKVVGGYYPSEFGITESDFYDDIHIRKTGLKKLGF